MGLRLATSIALARSVLNDTDPSSYRYSDVDLLAYANGAVRALVDLRPELFYEFGYYECNPDEVVQEIYFEDARSVVNVLRRADGGVVWPCDLATLSAYDPNWGKAASAPAVNWAPHPGDPRRFFIYPPAPAGQVLELVYVRMPPGYGANDDTGLPETLAEAIADYIVAMAESRNEESVTSQRAAQFMQQFVSRVKGV